MWLISPSLLDSRELLSISLCSSFDSSDNCEVLSSDRFMLFCHSGWKIEFHTVNSQLCFMKAKEMTAKMVSSDFFDILSWKWCDTSGRAMRKLKGDVVVIISFTFAISWPKSWKMTAGLEQVFCHAILLWYPNPWLLEGRGRCFPNHIAHQPLGPRLMCLSL